MIVLDSRVFIAILPWCFKYWIESLILITKVIFNHIMKDEKPLDRLDNMIPIEPSAVFEISAFESWSFLCERCAAGRGMAIINEKFFVQIQLN